MQGWNNTNENNNKLKNTIGEKKGEISHQKDT